MRKKYKIGVDLWAMLLFLAIMLPNFIWFAFPAPNDILRAESITPILDGTASVCQVLFAAMLILIKDRDVPPIQLSSSIVCVLIWYIVYIAAWIFYYKGNVNSVVIVLLCIAPCLSFGTYAVNRRNIPAMIPLAVFSVSHLLYGIFNFIL